MTDWPITLPQHFMRSGFTRAPRPNIIASPTEVGDGKRRRRSTARRQVWTLTFMMTADQVAIFEAFFADDLEDGALPFDLVYPITGDTWRFLLDVEAPWQIGEPQGVEYPVALNVAGRIIAYAP